MSYTEPSRMKTTARSWMASQDIETLQDRDEDLEELWASFADVPMNPETECIEEKFMGWEPGTSPGGDLALVR